MSAINIDQRIDLRTVKCPLNYVQTKLKLEEMSSGEVLEVWLDDGEPIINVPRSAKEDGYQILAVEKNVDYYKVLIKKS